MLSNNTQARKANIRLELRARRQKLSPEDQRHAATLVAEHVLALPAFSEAEHIALYLANDGEISTLNIIKAAEKLGKHCYLPQVTGSEMRFLHYQQGDGLIENCYGIPEPKPDAIERPANTLDLVLLPLVGFDKSGRRLGMGGGFYDRCFEFKQQQASTKPILIGLAHQCQQVRALPNEAWDIPLDNIVSDDGSLY